jgi:tRNA pseudouridine38-40 synthase
MPERVIKATVAYDGTDFVGWQVQATGRTVQGAMEEALARMHGHPVRVSGAGRTDSGVHATGQVASFRTDLDSIRAERFREAVNSYLPRDVRIVESREAGPRFDARRSARLRVYRYYLETGPVLLPHLRRYRHWVPRRLDLPRLGEMASLLVGDHDFTSFSAEGAEADGGESRLRTVTVSGFEAEGDSVTYTVAAISFLWKMVRTIVGTMLELEQSGCGRAELQAILDGRSRSRAGPTAPARGLFLEKVVYDEA